MGSYAAGLPGSDPMVISNPILKQLALASPNDVPTVLVRLGDVIRGSGPIGIPRQPSPTPSERAQLAKNPDFALAYRHNPEKALALLQRVNSLIKGDRN
jgi:hypothetical protein